MDHDHSGDHPLLAEDQLALLVHSLKGPYLYQIS